MKKITLKTVLAGIILSVIPMIYGQPPGSGWTLKWMDDFNGTAVDENKWKIDDNRIRDADKNKTCYERENVSVSGGILRLKVDNKGCDCGAEYIYSGAQISSTGDFYNNKYGYIEARLRYNYTGPGFWGNFWMSSTEGWPPEFDIAECIGNEPTKMTLAYHYEDASGAKKSSGARPSCTWHDWHIYGIEWLEGQPLRFYIDGVKVFEPSVSLTYPPNEKMNVLLRMGAFNSSTWGGLPDSTTVYPGYAEYDWVKVWEKTGTGNTPPVVSLTSPLNNSTYTAPATINITATASDADGTVTKVEFYNGTVKLGEDATSPYSFTWSNVSEGMYTLIARAIDNSGASKSVSILVYVNPPSGTNEIWLETFSGLPDSTRTDSGTTTWNSSRPSGVFCVMGEEFCITNAGGEGVWTSQNINISGYASVTLSVDLQGMGQLDASGPNLDYIKVYYVIDGGAETLLYGQNGGWSDELKHTYTKTGLSGNTMKIVIRALTTGGGEYYYWDNIKVTAGEKINQPPVVSLQSPLNNASYVAPAAITLSATATDADGSIVVVEFYAGDTKIGEDNTAPYAFTWTSVQEGNYMLSARAIDNNGAIASSSQVLIKVNANVSVEEFFEDIYVYPTYTTGLLYVLNASGHLYSVVSLPGTVVMTGKIEGEKIDVSTLPEGMYLLHITGNRGVYVARINKQ